MFLYQEGTSHMFPDYYKDYSDPIPKVCQATMHNSSQLQRSVLRDRLKDGI